MVILVLNCGSSSIKYQVIDIEAGTNTLLAKGLVERIGLPEGDLTHKPVGKERFELHRPIPDHTTGIRLVLEALTNPVHGVIASLSEVKAVGHRVAHGGEFFPASCVVTDEVKEKIRALFEIAPLHNPANLEGILSIEKVLPGVPQAAVFDTSFHQTIPAINYMYALPYEYYEKYRVRKYGFHGTSHKFVAAKGAALAGLDLAHSKIVTCHIGNGASVTAVLDGRSFDTSMGFSPVDGLVMGTRCGEVDPSAITFIGEKEGMNYGELNAMMNKKSGVQGLTGLSSDMRD
ncbi:MAG TPA: acetate kinase, partial [Alistipes sp.]|nr:acetate kinase [Alistipes sp.]